MKKFVIGVLVGAVLSFSASAYADDIKSMIGKQVDDIAPVVVDGTQLPVQAVIIQGTSYAPVRAIGEAIGKAVDWKEGKVILDKKQAEQSTQTQYTERQIKFKIDDLNQLIYAKKGLLDEYPERIKDMDSFKKELSDLEAELKVWETRKADLEKATQP